jgi:hypothetical protein
MVLPLQLCVTRMAWARAARLRVRPDRQVGMPPGQLAPGLLYYGVTGTGRARYWLVLYYY